MTTTHINKYTQGRNMSRIARISVLASALLAAGLAQAQMAIRSVTAATQAGSEVIRIETTEPLKQLPAGFAIQSPARIALDFAGVANATGKSLFEINQGNLRSANVVEAGNRTRVVFNLNQAVNYETRVDGNALLVVLQPVVAAAPLASAGMVGTSFAEGVNPQASAPLQDIDFRRGADNTGRVIVNLGSSQTGVDIRQQGRSLVVEFLKTTLPEGLRRRLDVTDFGTPVRTITASQTGDRVRLTIEPTGVWEHSAYQSDNQFVLEVREVKADPSRLTTGPNYSGEKLSLSFQNIEVRSLLQVIADFTNFNIITSDTVAGNVTLRLKDVPWDQALDIILQAKGLGMRKTGNVIWIAPKDEITAREKAEFESAATVQTLEPLRTQAIQLNYAKASEVAGQLKSGGGEGGAAGGATTGVLSPRGSVVAETRTNQLFVTDIPSRIEEVLALIKKVDIPVRQVMIEARIVEADDRFARNLGVRLGGSDLRGVRGGTAGYPIGGGNRVTLGGSYNALSSSTLESVNTLDTINTSLVNLPAAGLGGAAPAAIALALFNPSANRFLNLEISALQADGKGQVVSSPRVITADQTKAIIEQGVEFPYQSATSSGATAVEFRKASLKLEVTPQITPEGGIILDVEVSKDTPGEVLAGGRAINTKRIKTQVLVDNGGTVVIGGIYESAESEGVTKVPFFGDLPVIGYLFRSKSREVTKSELLVFLTPRTLTEAVAAN
jgi:type IV pilus assembly protein PilQ